MSLIPIGIFASSAGGFAATGGSQVLTQNGWKYHIFTSSGTFTVASGESVLNILTINGGTTGGSGYAQYYNATGGNGGAGGNALYGPTTAPVSTSFAVTVGGAGGTSSVTPARSTTSVSGGAGGTGAVVNYDGSGPNATNGGSVPLYNTRGVPWSLLSFSAAANAGGGGGGAEGNFDYGSGNRSPGAGGTSGYNQIVSNINDGGASSNPGMSPGNGTGAGGGGGGAYSNSFYGMQISAAGGNGAGGIVIVAYPA